MKNAPNTTGHEFIIPHEHENFTPIEQIEEPYIQNPEEDDTIVIRKSKRLRTATSFGDDYIVYLVDDTPTTIKEAYSSPNADLWKEAVRSEMDSVMSRVILIQTITILVLWRFTITIQLFRNLPL